MKNIILCFLLTFFSFSVLAHKNTSSTNSDTVYKVGLYEEIPFSESKGNTYVGISIDIWRLIAIRENIKYEFVKTANNIEAVKLLKEGKLDAIIAPIAVTHERLKDITFSRPYFINKLGIISTKTSSEFWYVISSLLTSNLYIYIIVILFALLLFSATFLYFENYDKYPKKNTMRARITHALYLATISMISGDHLEIPNHPIVRLVHLFSLLTSLIIITSLIALFTSALTISTSDLDPKNMSQKTFFGKHVVVRKNSYAALVGHAMKLPLTTTNTLGEAIQKIKKHEATSLLDNYVALKAYINQHDDLDLEPLPLSIGTNELAFAFKPNLPIISKVNQALLFMQENNRIINICNAYLDSTDKKACII